VSRPRLPAHAVERIRRERLAPRPTDWNYLHLLGLRRSLEGAFSRLAGASGPVLDLYCGTQPYLELVPWRPVWGLDLDDHFGRANVIGALPLPFREGAFSVVLCTQALYLVDDPAGTVGEMHRVLAPGGHAVVTVPSIFRREIAAERRWNAAQLAGLFAGWSGVQVEGIGGLGTGLAYFPASLADAAGRRSRLLRSLLRPIALPVNAVGALAERLLRPLAGRYPASLIAVARRSEG
jgi:SAM-dependent methyltransferase